MPTLFSNFILIDLERRPEVIDDLIGEEGSEEEFADGTTKGFIESNLS